MSCPPNNISRGHFCTFYSALNGKSITMVTPKNSLHQDGLMMKLFPKNKKKLEEKFHTFKEKHYFWKDSLKIYSKIEYFNFLQNWSSHFTLFTLC